MHKSDYVLKDGFIVKLRYMYGYMYGEGDGISLVVCCMGPSAGMGTFFS